MTEIPSSRELVDKWLAALTIMGEYQKTPKERLELIREVNQPGAIKVNLETPLSQRDQQVLADAIDEFSTLRSRQTGAHLLIEEILMKWLGEATGHSRSHIVQQLALKINEVVPFD